MAEDDLSASLAGLAEMLTDRRDLRETLTVIAEYAVLAIPGADGAGLTMLDGASPQTVVASADFVRAVDDIQYGLGEGPCLLAVESGATQVSSSLGGDSRWPRFGPRVGRLGVHSALSLPLPLAGGVVGAMNVYAHDKDAFGPDAIRIGEMYVRPAAVSAHNAQVLSKSLQLSQQLREALTSRAVIDQALGILMSRSGLSADQAFTRLVSRSQTEHVKLAEIATAVVDEAVRRARARRPTDGSDDIGS